MQASVPELAREVQQLIEGEQERGYRNLAIKLGLGADPRKAYERVSGNRPPDSSSVLPFEDPSGSRIMALILGNAQRALAALGATPINPAPAFATLPSGVVNARVVIEPRTRVPVIFVERGLFHYFLDFCHLVGWFAPPFPARLLDEDLIGNPRSYAMPFEATQYFWQALGSYSFEGSTTSTSRVPRPEHNAIICPVLLTLMERFVMVHEMAHVQLGHLNGPEKSDHEFAADVASLKLVTNMTRQDGVGWGIGYWACELALLAINLLYRSIGIAQFGDKKLGWIDATHPDPLSRREMLRQIWLDPNAPPAGVDAARELCGMSDAIYQQLWEIVAPMLLLSHQRGSRPSPVWQALISNTFVSRD